jgi:GST-like protein
MKAMSEEFVVSGKAGTGSVAVEAALTLLGLPFRVVEEPWTGAFEGVAHTPIGQVPVLRLPGGELMTESAAILIWLADRYPAAGLAPLPDAPTRPAFLRWMSFVSSAIYALYWVKDVPARIVAGAEAESLVKTRLAERIAHLWSVMEAQINPGRYLLGDDLTVLDLYVTVVSRWTPRAKLHEEIAPRIGEIARRVEADPRLAALWNARFAVGETDES